MVMCLKKFLQRWFAVERLFLQHKKKFSQHKMPSRHFYKIEHLDDVGANVLPKVREIVGTSSFQLIILPARCSVLFEIVAHVLAPVCQTTVLITTCCLCERTLHKNLLDNFYNSTDIVDVVHYYRLRGAKKLASMKVDNIVPI